MGKRTIVTIGREFGSGGREIGKKLAEELHIAFYDKELLEIAAKESGISKELFENNDEKPTSSLLYSISVNPYGMGSVAGVQEMPISQKLFLAQFTAIQRIARNNDCVIVGRCADYALRSEPDCVNVFIHAPLQYRVERVKSSHEISSGEAHEMILKTDKKRAAYYNSYSDKKWGDISGYHLAFDSSVLGVARSAALIRDFINARAMEATD